MPERSSDLQEQLKKHQGLSKAQILKRALFIIIGAVIMAVGLEIFLVPNNVIDGESLGSRLSFHIYPAGN